MIREDKDGKYNKSLIKPFRRTGPLDAYIYQKGTNEENMEECKQNVMIHRDEL